VNFPLNVYAAALAGAFIASWLALPLWRRVCLHVGLVDDPGHRKIHETPIPLAGGFAILTGMVVPLLIGVAVLYWNHADVSVTERLLSHGMTQRKIQLAGIVLGAMGILVLGALDDRYELRPTVKFGGQFGIALLVAAAKVRITLFVPHPAFSYMVTILWILTVINAFNFMDNMNGLCAGLGAIGGWLFAVIAAIEGQYLVALLGLLVCGSLLGFLPHNFPRAAAFLGDAGSHLVGYLLAIMAILPHFYNRFNPHAWAVFTPLLVLAVPLADLVWVVLLRWRLGRPFYVGDNNHLSHRLVRRGCSRPMAVLLIWFCAAVVGNLAVLLALF
jgi:UDP-GlcNAc:undecaprenyl-phosphate/decaprenyl-phosphate GlcNAc-1-phosphate transferase